MSDIIDDKEARDWVYVIAAVPVSIVQAVRDMVETPGVTQREIRIRRMLRYIRRAHWPHATTGAELFLTVAGYTIFQGDIDRDQLSWLSERAPGIRFIRSYERDGREVGQTRNELGEITGTPTYRELTAAQENALRTAWQTLTGRTGNVQWYGVSAGFVEVVNGN